MIIEQLAHKTVLNMGVERLPISSSEMEKVFTQKFSQLIAGSK